MRPEFAAALLLVAAQSALAAESYRIPLFLADGDAAREGFARIINRSDRRGTVSIVAIDDEGRRSEPIVLTLAARAAVQFNSGDLEHGNPVKGLSGSSGDGVGDWRLELTTDLDIEPLAYARTVDGFLTSLHDVVPAGEYLPHGDYVANSNYVPILNPGSNSGQQSLLRLINPNQVDVYVSIFGRDDAGSVLRDDDGGARVVSLRLPAAAAGTFTAAELESGGDGLEGALGDGTGKWTLGVVAERPVLAMSLLLSETGHLTNLSTLPGYRQAIVPLFLSTSAPARQGFVRVVNPSNARSTVAVSAVDDTGRRTGPIRLSLGAFNTAHFNSNDLEAGNPSKGISQGVGGAAGGHWRLELSSDLPIGVSAFVRTTDGFVTSMHDVGLEADSRHHLPIFNPGSNERQLSLLRLVNPGQRDVEVEVSGIDDAGTPSAGEARFTLPAGTARTIRAAELERGGDFHGGLGDGVGKWRLTVVADGPIHAMSLMQSSGGALTNLSRTHASGLGRPSSSYKLTGADSAAVGRQVASVGDLDGGGVPDLLVGAAGSDASPDFEEYAGAAWLVSGESLAEADAQDGTTDGIIALGGSPARHRTWRFEGTAGGDLAGIAAAPAGDLDGDGSPELLIGAPGHDAGAEDAGAVYVVASSEVSAAVAGVVALEDLAPRQGSWKLVGEAHYDLAGFSLASLGDFDRDGVADFAIGAPGDTGPDDVETEVAAPGAVYLVSGASLPAADRVDGLEDGVVALGNLAARRGSWKLVGERDFDRAGTSVASAGDVDGDGRQDLLIGAPGHRSGTDEPVGSAYLVSAAALPIADAADGDADGVIQLANVAGQTESWKLLGEQDFGRAGASVASAGDVDGDGRADLVVGRRPSFLFEPGPVHVVTAAALAPLDAADDRADGVIDLGNAGGQTGSWKLIARGFVDDYDSGRSVYYTRAGFSVASAGDVNGDGLADLLVGTRNGGRQPQVVRSIRAAFLLSGADLTALDDESGAEDGVIDLDKVRFQARASWQFVGEGEDNAGVSVAAAGDLDGDGLADIVIGADAAGADDGGAAYIVSAADFAVLDRLDGFADGVILLGRIAGTRRSIGR